MKRQRATRAARQRAFFATLAALGARGAPTRLLARDRQKLGVTGPLTAEKYRRIAALIIPPPRPAITGYTLAITFPDRRKRDDDNLLAGCKAYRDGIADALLMDDIDLPMLERPVIAHDPAQPAGITFHLIQR